MTHEDRQERENSGQHGDGEAGIIVFGGGSGCSGRGCLFWVLISVVLSVTLTVLLNLFFYLFSGPSAGI